MSCRLADEMFVTLVFWIDSNSAVPKHSLHSSRCNFNSLFRAVDGVFEVREDAEFHFALVTGNVKKSSSLELFINNLQVRDCCVQLRAPITKSIRAVYETLLV